MYIILLLEKKHYDATLYKNNDVRYNYVLTHGSGTDKQNERSIMVSSTSFNKSWSLKRLTGVLPLNHHTRSQQRTLFTHSRYVLKNASMYFNKAVNTLLSVIYFQKCCKIFNNVVSNAFHGLTRWS